LLLTLAVLPQARAGEILVVASSSAELYRGFVDRFTASLADAPMAGISVIYLDRDSLTAGAIAASDIIVTVGTRAAREAGENAPDKPLLNTIIPESTFRMLAAPAGTCPARSAIFIDQPLARQAALARAMFPSARSYGILLGPTSAQRHAEIDALQKKSDRQLVVTTAGDDSDISVTSNGLLHQVDVLLAVNDPLVLNRENAKWLLYSAYQNRLPVIGFSRAYVKAGAAGAVFSEPGQMARQAAAIMRKWLGDPSGCLPAPGFPVYFSVAVNQSVCSSLGGASCDEDALGRQLADEESAQ
jgi:ABC-type uncharacterized transport system substrate-binding protein